MTTHCVLLPLALAIALSVSPRLNAGPAFNDGDFTTYTWTAVELQDTTATQNAGFNAGEASPGGYQGGAFRSNSFGFFYNGTATNQGIIIGNLSSGVTYDPSVSGAINSISSFGIAASASVSAGAPGLSLSVGLLLLQGGIYYTNQLQPVAASWANLKEPPPFLAADFTPVGSSGPANPDFTINGGAIELGYVTAASLSSGASPQAIAGSIGADYFVLTISNTPTMAQFSGQQPANGTNLLVTLSGLAAGETITWLVSTDLADWSTNNPSPTSTAAGTNGTFTITNSVYPAAPNWFLRALVQ